jgi:catechol 2,3-dioxygenase-like lactoylglutathione lyase family enzyme
MERDEQAPRATLHHVAFRVTDIEEATRFYEDALDASIVADSVLHEGAFAEMVVGGPPGAAFIVRSIRVGEVGIELFEFVSPRHAVAPIHPSVGGVLHLALHVDDVRATVERVEAAGGRNLWPEIVVWGSASGVYVADPDHNVIELLSASFDDVAAQTIALRPEADPRRRSQSSPAASLARSGKASDATSEPEV